MNTKHSIAFVIYNPERTHILLVQRPAEDRFPNAWGLPAGTRKETETDEECIHRAAQQKLGISIHIQKKLNHGSIERKEYTLYMNEYEVQITQGIPSVPQQDHTVTQYQAWKWGTPEELIPTAQQGSLCSQLFLTAKHVNF